MLPIFNELTSSQKQVLDLIRIYGEISSAEIARHTGLQPSTIVYIIKTLTANNLIEVSKTGISTSKGGKKPTLLKINSETGYIIGLEVLLKKFKATIIDFAGNVISHSQFETDTSLTEENIVVEILKVISSIKKNKHAKNKNLIGIGIAVPGLVNSKKGIILYSTKLKLENFSLKESIENQLKIPVYVANDANSGVIGVKWFQENEKPFSQIMYLIYNQDAPNIGAGIIINNKIYEGHSGSAGEITIELPMIKDLIILANKQFYDKRENIQYKPLDSDISLGSIIELSVDKNSHLAEFVLEKLCLSITDIVTFITGLINPAQIVFGGDLAEYNYLIDKYIKNQLYLKTSSYVSHGFRLPEIKISQFGSYSVSIGATALVLKELYS